MKFQILSKPQITILFGTMILAPTNQEIFWFGHDNDVEPFYEYFWRGQLGRCAGALETGFGDLGSSLHYVRAWPVSFYLTHVCFSCVLLFCKLSWDPTDYMICYL